ncbi:MAG: glutaredoxin 3 [Pseudomonadota bacterium]|nr:MAG: glutaredoxin 3 [Pseudomonadota bacterium]
MVKVTVYSTRVCPYCRMAEKLLDKKGVAYDKIMIDEQPEQRAHMERLSGRKTVPQIFVNSTHIGGFTDLAALDRAGKLDTLLARA